VAGLGLSVCLICPSVCQSIRPSFRTSVCLSVCLPACLPACLVFYISNPQDCAAGEEVDQKGAFTLEVGMPLYGLQHLEMLWEPLHDTKCLVAWNSSTILLAFRGTVSLKNALSDAQVRQCGDWKAWGLEVRTSMWMRSHASAHCHVDVSRVTAPRKMTWSPKLDAPILEGARACKLQKPTVWILISKYSRRLRSLCSPGLWLLILAK
jgi:hypothetical protein